MEIKKEIFLPDDYFLNDDGFLKRDTWEEFTKVLIEKGLDPKDYEDMLEWEK